MPKAERKAVATGVMRAEYWASEKAGSLAARWVDATAEKKDDWKAQQQAEAWAGQTAVPMVAPKALMLAERWVVPKAGSWVEWRGGLAAGW